MMMNVSEHGDTSRQLERSTSSSSAKSASASVPLEQRFRDETLKIHRWQVQANLDLEAKHTALKRAEEGERAARKEAAQRAAQVQRGQEDFLRLEESHRMLEGTLKAERAKASLSEEGLVQLGKQIELQETALDHVEGWKEQAEKRLQKMTAKVEHWDLKRLQQLQQEKEEARKEREEVGKEREQTRKEMQKLQAALKDTQGKLKAVTEEASQSSKLLDQERQNGLHLSDKLRLVESHKGSQEREVSALKQELLASKAKVLELAEGEQELLLQLRAQEDKTDNQERSLHHLQDQLAATRDESSKTVEQQKTALSQLQAEAQKAKAHMESLEKRFNAKEAEFQDGQETINKLKETILRLKENEESLKQEHRKNTQEVVSKYKDLVNRLTKDNEELAKENGDKAVHCKEVHSRTTELEQELAKEKQKGKNLGEMHRAAILRMGDQDIDIKRLKDTEEELRKKIQALEEEKKKTNTATAKQSMFLRPAVPPVKKASSGDSSQKPAEEKKKAPAAENTKRKLILSDASDDEDYGDLFSAKRPARTYALNKNGTRKRTFFKSKNNPSLFD